MCFLTAIYRVTERIYYVGTKFILYIVYNVRVRGITTVAVIQIYIIIQRVLLLTKINLYKKSRGYVLIFNFLATTWSENS